MTDRELLRLAAAAAGIADGDVLYDMERDKTWNPLIEDGDALRLAVKLRIQITPGTYNEYEATAFRAGAAEAHEKATMGYEIEAATRRAIVRAAAEIGRAMS